MPLKTNILAGIIAEAGSSYVYQNAQAAQWATKLTTPLSYSVAAAYDQLFTEIGDIITAKFDSFGICATETQEAAIKNLVFSAPDLTLLNPEILSFQPFHGFSQLDFGVTTRVERLLIKNGGSGHVEGTTTITIGAPTGAGPVQAVFTPIIEGGVIVGATPVNKGAGYVYTATGSVPTVTVSGPGTGTQIYADLYIGRICTNTIPAGAGMKAGQQDISIAIGSTQYNGTRGAALGGGSLTAMGTSSRVSLGSTISTWMGGKVGGGADIGVYSTTNTGHYVFQRIASTGIDRYFNGNKLSSASLAFTTNMANEPLYLGARFENEAWKNISRHSWFWIGKALTDQEMLRMYYAINRMLSGFVVEAAAVVPFSTSMTVS